MQGELYIKADHIRSPWPSLSLSLLVCVSVSVSLGLCVCQCRSMLARACALSLSLSLRLSLSLSLSLSRSLSLSLSLSPFLTLFRPPSLPPSPHPPTLPLCPVEQEGEDGGRSLSASQYTSMHTCVTAHVPQAFQGRTALRQRAHTHTRASLCCSEPHYSFRSNKGICW
jgi:hypothetical protein